MDPQDPSRQDPGLLRPYAVAGGRARSRYAELEIESLVITTLPGETVPGRTRERRAIALLCRQPISIAEIAAHLELPLGVARVLVGDMAAEGLVVLNRPASTDPQLDRMLLQRVLDGLRRI